MFGIIVNRHAPLLIVITDHQGVVAAGPPASFWRVRVLGHL